MVVKDNKQNMERKISIQVLDFYRSVCLYGNYMLQERDFDRLVCMTAICYSGSIFTISDIVSLPSANFVKISCQIKKFSKKVSPLPI